MATTLEIVNAISQVLANSYDGALDESGEPVKIGLAEKGNPLIDHELWMVSELMFQVIAYILSTIPKFP